jgi:uncharacterized protein YjbI with pentapeptide repeats
MKKCKHFKICSLYGDADKENGLCILHSRNPKKSKKDFAIALKEHRAKNGNNFGSMVFPYEILFEDEAFETWTSFRDCIFYDNVSFRNSNFKERADFSGIDFHKYAIFDFAIFKKSVHFTASIFRDFTSFIGTEFYERVSFHNVKATLLTFSGVKFVKGGKFSQLNLHGANVRFIGCFFSGNTIFDHGWKGLGDAWRGEEVSYAFSGAEQIEFIMCEIDPSAPLIFRVADMSNVEFNDIRLSDVEFTDVIWPKISDFFGLKRLAVYNEIRALERIGSEKDKNKIKALKGYFIHLERNYRDIKNNYENDKDWIRAGDFHYSEKEMRRKNPNTNLILRFFLFLYWVLSGYGERYLRPIFWTFFLLLISTVGYLIFGIAPDGCEDHVLQLSQIRDWFSATLYGLQVITLQKPIDFQPVSLSAKTIKVFQSIFGPILFGFFALALRQRMRR